MNNKQLRDVSKRISSYSLPRRKETKEFTGFKYIHYGDIHTKVANIINEDDNLPNIEVGQYEVLQKYDIVVADASEDYQGIGQPAIVLFEPRNNIVAGLHTYAIRPNLEKVDALYLFYLIKSQKFKRYGYKVGTGMKVFGINVDNFMNFSHTYPSKGKQTQIGNFFKKLDELIELQQATISNIEKMKKGFLRMIFPEYGKKISKISFSKNYSQWGIDHLKNLSTEENKGKIQASEISNNKMDRTLYLDANRLNGGKSQYTSHKKDTNINDIIMLWDGSKAGQVFIGFEGILGSTLKRFVINDEYNSNFIYYQLKKHERRILLNYRTPNIPHVVKDFSSIFKINTLDDFNIQKVIGTFFNSLDCLIELENKELELLQEMKKGFLQKMFV